MTAKPDSTSGAKSSKGTCYIGWSYQQNIPLPHQTKNTYHWLIISKLKKTEGHLSARPNVIAACFWGMWTESLSPKGAKPTWYKSLKVSAEQEYHSNHNQRFSSRCRHYHNNGKNSLRFKLLLPNLIASWLSQEAVINWDPSKVSQFCHYLKYQIIVQTGVIVLPALETDSDRQLPSRIDYRSKGPQSHLLWI